MLVKYAQQNWKELYIATPMTQTVVCPNVVITFAIGNENGIQKRCKIRVLRKIQGDIHILNDVIDLDLSTNEPWNGTSVIAEKVPYSLLSMQWAITYFSFQFLAQLG